MINVFIVGSKGIPARYGGFETFVENLTKRKKSTDIKYFVTSMGDGQPFEYNDATCVPIPIKKDSSFNRILNVSTALKWIESYISNHDVKDENIVYILGCRVGLLLKKHKKKLQKLKCSVVVNPDGLEWKRGKWNTIQKKVLLLSEKGLVKNADYIICDSIGIKDYIINKYKKVNSLNVEYIAYGCDLGKSKTSDKELDDWLNKFDVLKNQYYLIIGRFVPENNYYLIIDGFMRSKTKKKLLIISNVEHNSFYKKLEDELKFSSDDRIVFAGTCYDEELVKKIREEAFCYIHGHSVGGTNPSLLEALGSTKINLLYNVPFNKEVGEDECVYFGDDPSKLSKSIDDIELKYNGYIEELHPSLIIESRFKWDDIVSKYENYFKKIAKH